MFVSRREFIKKCLSFSVYGISLASGFLYSSLAKAQRKKETFQARSYEKIVEILFDKAKFIDSRKINISRLPRVAENGAAVPLSVSTSLKNVEKITILVEKNPHPLIVEFYLSPAVTPRVSARIKMADTSHVVVIVEAAGKLYKKTQYVKVIEGGCG